MMNHLRKQSRGRKIGDGNLAKGAGGAVSARDDRFEHPRALDQLQLRRQLRRRGSLLPHRHARREPFAQVVQVAHQIFLALSRQAASEDAAPDHRRDAAALLRRWSAPRADRLTAVSCTGAVKGVTCADVRSSDNAIESLTQLSLVRFRKKKSRTIASGGDAAVRHYL